MKKNLADFIIEKRALVIIIFLCVTAFFLYGTKGLSFKMVDAGLRPEAYPNIKLNDEFRKKFGGANQLTIVVQTRDKEDGGDYDDIFNAETLNTVKSIDTDLRNIEKFPGIDHNKIFGLASSKVKDIIVNSSGMKFPSIMYPTVPQTADEIEKMRIRIYQSFAYPAVVSFDSKKTMITADFLGGKADYADLFEKLKALRQTYENKNILVSINCPALEHGYVEGFIPKVARFMGIAFLLMMIIVFLSLRSVQAALITGLAGVLNAVWGLGFLGFLHFNLDPAVFGLPFFISLIAFVNTVFFIKRFSGEMTIAGKPAEAAKTTICTLAGPCASTMLIAGIALLLVSLAPFPAMRPLFLSGIFWAFASFAIVIGFVPVLLTYMPVTTKKADDATLLGRFMKCSAGWVCGWGKYAVIAGTLLATIWGCIQLNQVSLGNTAPGSPVLWPWHRYNIDGFRIAFSFGGLFPLLIIMQGDQERAISDNIPLLRDTMDFSRYLKQTPNRRVPMALSLLTGVDGKNRGARENDPNWNFIPTLDGQLGSIYSQTVGTVLDRFIDSPEKTMCMICYCFDKSEATIKQVMDRIREYITNQSKFGIRHSDMQYTGLDKFMRGMDSMITTPAPLLPEKPPIDKLPHVYYRIGGGPVGIQADVNDCVRLYFFWTLVFASLAIVLVIGLRYGSLLCGMFALLPLFFSGAMAFVVMVAASKPQPFLPLTPETLPFVIIGFSLFVGGVLYMLDRIRQSYVASMSWDQAISDAMCTTGRAVFSIGMIFLVGLIPVMSPFTMHFVPFSVLSILLIVMALCGMIATIYVIPSFVALFKSKCIARGNRG